MQALSRHANTDNTGQPVKDSEKFTNLEPGLSTERERESLGTSLENSGFHLSRVIVTNRHVFLLCDFISFRCRVFLLCDLNQLGITGNIEVTQDGPGANRLLLHLSNCAFPSLQLLCKQEPSRHKLVC